MTMKRGVQIGILICLAGIATFAQTENPKPEGVVSVELFSPFVEKGGKPGYEPGLYMSSCLDLLRLERRCGGAQAISYGTRIGINDSLFNVHGGQESRTRMIEIGKYDWTDKFTVPEVKLWRPLGPGEQRTVSMNASGADGAPGRNADDVFAPFAGTQRQGKDYANAPVNEQVGSVVKKDGKIVRTDPYNPLVVVKKGHMYAVRVFDKTTEHYVLVHVDDVVRGKSVVLSFKKLEVARPIF